MRVLVIEDEEKHRRVIGLHLAGADYEVKAVGTAEEGWKLAGDVDLILTDLKLPGMDGLELLAKLRDQNSHTPVIVMSAFGTVENAVEAMKRTELPLIPEESGHHQGPALRSDCRGCRCPLTSCIVKNLAEINESLYFEFEKVRVTTK